MTHVILLYHNIPANFRSKLNIERPMVITIWATLFISLTLIFCVTLHVLGVVAIKGFMAVTAEVD